MPWDEIIPQTHACDRCSAGFALAHPDAVPEWETEHFLRTGCKGGLRQVAKTPLEVIAGQMSRAGFNIVGEMETRPERLALPSLADSLARADQRAFEVARRRRRLAFELASHAAAGAIGYLVGALLALP